MGHEITKNKVRDDFTCASYCLRNCSCQSFNLFKRSDNQYTCELNSATDKQFPGDLVFTDDHDVTYHVMLYWLTCCVTLKCHSTGWVRSLVVAHHISSLANHSAFSGTLIYIGFPDFRDPPSCKEHSACIIFRLKSELVLELNGLYHHHLIIYISFTKKRKLL